MANTAALQNEVARQLRIFEDKPAAALFANLARADHQSEKPHVCTPEVVSHWRNEPTEADFQAVGRRFFDLHKEQIQQVVCTAYSRAQIDNVLTVENVLAVVGLIAGVAGLAVVMPGVLVSFAILVFKLGLDRFCESFPAPANP